MTSAALESIEEMITREYRRINAQLASKGAAHLSMPLKETWEEIVRLRGVLDGLKSALSMVIAKRDENQLSLEGRLL